MKNPTGNKATDNPLPCILMSPKVLEFFKFASNPKVTISVPSVHPKGGEVYLFVPESLQVHN